MILPSNLPSPAGYSFGSYTSAAVDDHPSDSLKRTTSIPEQQQHHDVQGDAASTESSSISPSLASPTASLLFKGSDGGHRSLSGLLLNRDSNTNHNNSSNNSRSLSSNHHHNHVGSTTGATAVPAAAAPASAGLGSTTYLRSSPSLAPTIGATTDGTSAASSSLSVALCRSLVLKYIYLTYLFLAHYLVVVPTTAFQYYILRRIPGTKGLSAAPSSSPFRDEQGRDVDEHGHVLDSAVGEQFLQQYTLDNHRRGSRPQVYEANYTTASTSTLTSTNHSHNQIGVSSSNNNNNNSNSNNSSGGTTMLRRSSRFKSKSDLEEIAQQSAATITASGTLAGTSMALLRKSSADSGTGLSSDPGMGSLASSGVGGGGYGTDSSMAEDAGSGRGHLRLRQRLTGRPSSGLGTPGSGGSGRHGLSKTKTLVLDLDETLIHSTSRGSRSQGYMVEVLVDRHACLYYVYKRPHVDYFLKKVSEWYKLVIFTASMAEYADPVIDWLDQNRTLFDQRYFRQACQYRNGSYLKDLSIVESDLSSVCLLDNSPLSYSLNKENGIPIDSWINDPDDEALLDLLPFLDALRFTEDVRSVLSLRTV